MKLHSAFPFVAAAVFAITTVQTQAQNGNWCGTDEQRRLMIEANPDLLRQEAEYENGLQAYLKARDTKREGDDSTTYVIPLVFHVLYDPTAADDNHNVSDEQIQQQVDQLNLDYAAMNSDLDQVCCGYVPKIGNVKVRWELATKDPYGLCTNGIDRITSLRSSSAGNFSKLNPWFRQHYVNVWVIKNFPPIPGGGTLLGFSQLPADVQDASGTLRDGVIMIYNSLSSFGGGDATTLTHELGHYLNLQHTWGSTNDPTVSCGDDGVGDTPVTKGHNNCSPQSLYDSFCSLTPLIGNYDFNDVTTFSGVASPTAPASLIYPGDTTETVALTYSQAVAHGVSGNSSIDGEFAFNDWDTGATDMDTSFVSLTGSLNSAKYYEITVSPQLGHSMRLTGLTFKVDRSNDGPRTFAVRSNVTNNFGTNLAATLGPVDSILNVNGTTFYFDKDTSGIGSKATVTVSGDPYTNQITPITFRIYAWNAESDNGSFTVDSLTVKGQYGIIENTQNYMEYSGCSHMFTEGQADRMRFTLASGTSDRNNLWNPVNQAQVGINGNQVSCAPEADFYTRTPFVCEGTQVQFKANVKRATATYWNWTFDGGTPATSTDENPFVSFEGPGYRNVTLTAGNDQGENTISKPYEILIGAGYSEVNGLLNQSFNNINDFWSWPVLNYENNSSYWGWTDAAGHDAPGSAILNASQTYDKVQDIFSTTSDFLHDQDIILTPSLDLSNVSSVEFSFWFAYKTRTNVAADITESLEISYSTDCGKTWLVKDNISGGELVTAGIGDAGYIPTAGDWRQMNYSMSSIVQDNQVRFRFRYTSGPFSNDLFLDDVKISGVVGIDELAQSGSLSLFPNPATDQLTINVDLAGSKTGQLSFLDMTGRKVYVQQVAAGAQQLELDLGKLGISRGVYMVRLENGLGQRTEKLVVR